MSRTEHPTQRIPLDNHKRYTTDDTEDNNDVGDSQGEEVNGTERRGRYISRGVDRHPNIPMSQVLLFPRYRPGRLTHRIQGDKAANVTYGDAIVYKDPKTIRFMFQNVKGLTYSSSGEDYKYFLSSMLSYSVDVFGMAETNSGWQHAHMQSTFKQCVRRQLQYGKTVFGAPTALIDPLDDKETFQAGGVTQVVRGPLTTSVFGSSITDSTGLGRWCGFTFIGKAGQKFSVITGYRTCSGAISTAPLGSTFHREYVYYQEKGERSPQPRTRFITDLSNTIKRLQTSGHAILVMMDANAVLGKDTKLGEMLLSHDLEDLHKSSPAPSTYIGSDHRRIDYMFGCPRTVAAISRQGTLSYFEGPQSDHRALYIDLNILQLFGAEITEQQLPPSISRALKSGNPELVSKYLREMRNYYSIHSMKERIDTLYSTHQSLSREQVRRLLSSWDEDQGRAMRAAEKLLRFPPKLYKWSPRLRNAGVLMRYWKLRLRELQYDEDYTATFLRWERQIQSRDPNFVLQFRSTKLSIEQVRIHLNQATKHLRMTQKAATELHHENYSELLESYELDADAATQQESKRKAKIIKRTMRSETSRQLFGKIRQIMRPTEYSALTQILVPRPRTQEFPTAPGQVHNVLQSNEHENLLWDTVISRADIEEHLLTFNRESFRAAAESPCGHGVIHDALTFTSLTPEAEALLQGEVPEEWFGDRQLLREFLASFRIPESVLATDPISQVITADDIVKGFKSWKETTTTSPSGRHLGHYKALIQDAMLLECFRKFINIAISRGISIPRWCQAVNVMIEKDTGNPRINRLRIIHLFEADYNLFLKIMWGSRLVKRAVKLNLLNNGQHGSVPGRTTMDPVMLNQLTTDMCRLLKVNYARFDNDASACFDRIIVALGMLAARRCGMPEDAIRTHAKSLELMQYMVKTIYGVSEDAYSGTALEPLFGTGQGSGASPAVWLTLVVLLLNTLERVVPDRISFRSEDGSTIHTRLVDAFVDDTAIGITDDGSKTLSDLIGTLEKVAQTWEQLLHFSGGALNLKKCSWYVMYWDWRQGRPHIRAATSDDPSIQLYQGSRDRTKTNIRRQAISEATRILGVYQTPAGDFAAHIKVLKAKADTYAGYLKSPRLSTTDVRVFHKTIYDPAMRYSLPAVAVDEEELDSIQSKVIPTIVQKLGFTSKLPTAIRFGPTTMGGLGLMDLRTEAGIEMIKYFRHEVYGNTEVGKLFLIQLQASQIESGIGTPLLEEPDIHIPYLTPTWITSMRQFMSNHNLRITITDLLPHSTLKGKHDQYIMEPHRLKGYSIQQKRDLNLTRIFLQVTTIADMADRSEPTKIAEWAITGTRPSNFIANRAWPRQNLVSQSQKRLWRRYISSQFLRYDRKWKTPPMATITELKQSTTLKTSSPPTTSTGIFSDIKKLPRYKKRLLSYVKLSTDIDHIWSECRRKQTLTITSDGGLKGRRGTFGWSVTTPNNVTLCEGAGPVDGPFDTANSTRCELGGYAAALLMLSLLNVSWGTRYKCKFRWVTDSKSAIQNVSDPQLQRRQPSNPDYMGIIRSGTTSLRRRVTPVWVKGHQIACDNSSGKSFDIKRNNHVDALATWYREQSTKRQSCELTDHALESRISITINGMRLVSQVEESIRFHINGYQLRLYTQSKYRWSNSTWNRIDVEVLGRFFRKLSPAKQAAQTKFIYDQWNTGKVRYQNAKVKDCTLKICPCCRESDETPTHVLRCSQNPAHLTSVQQFKQQMSPAEQHPVYQILKAGILAWIDGCDDYQPQVSEFPTKFHDSIRVASRDQKDIGWHNALKGYLSVEWRTMAACDMYGSSQQQTGQGFQYIQRILQALHKMTQAKWQGRNQTLHNGKDSDNQRIRDAEFMEITELYRQADRLRPSDRHYCEQPLSVIIKKNPSSRRRWLRYVRQSQARAHEGRLRQTVLTSYFRSTVSSPPEKE